MLPWACPLAVLVFRLGGLLKLLACPSRAQRKYIHFARICFIVSSSACARCVRKVTTCRFAGRLTLGIPTYYSRIAPTRERYMMMFKPFALIAACALGLTSMANPVAAQVCLGIPRYCGLDGCPACECSGRRLTKLDDPFLFLDGKYDEDAQEHLAQRRKLQLCYCGSDTSTPVTQSECCDGCGKGKGT